MTAKMGSKELLAYTKLSKFLRRQFEICADGGGKDARQRPELRCDALLTHFLTHNSTIVSKSPQRFKAKVCGWRGHMQFPVPISKAPLFSTSSVRVCVCVMHFHQVQQVIYFRCVFCQTSVEEIDINCHEAHDDLSSTLEEAGKKQREGSSMLEMAFLRTHFRFCLFPGGEG